MKRAAWIRTTALVGLLGVAVSACGGGGGGKNRTGNPAIDALLTQIYASMRSGSKELDPSFTTGSIDNPFEMPVAGDETGFPIGGTGDDGTVSSVDVHFTVTKDTTTGAYSVVLHVDEPGTGHRFLSSTGNCGKLSLSVRVPPYAFAQISPTTGTGTAYVIFQYAQSCSGTQTFANQSPGGATLVDPTALSPAPPTSASFTSHESGDLLAEFQITSNGGQLTASLTGLVGLNGSDEFERSGGPDVKTIRYALSSLTVDGNPVSTSGSDVWFAIGNDWGLSAISISDAPVSLMGSVTGGVSGSTLETDFFGGAINSTDTTTNTTFTFNSTTATDDNDGFAEISTIVLSGSSEESIPSLNHSLDVATALKDEMDVKFDELLYLQSVAETVRQIVVLE